MHFPDRSITIALQAAAEGYAADRAAGRAGCARLMLQQTINANGGPKICAQENKWVGNVPCGTCHSVYELRPGYAEPEADTPCPALLPEPDYLKLL